MDVAADIIAAEHTPSDFTAVVVKGDVTTDVGFAGTAEEVTIQSTTDLTASHRQVDIILNSTGITAAEDVLLNPAACNVNVGITVSTRSSGIHRSSGTVTTTEHISFDGCVGLSDVHVGVTDHVSRVTTTIDIAFHSSNIASVGKVTDVHLRVSCGCCRSTIATAVDVALHRTVHDIHDR